MFPLLLPVTRAALRNVFVVAVSGRHSFISPSVWPSEGDVLCVGGVVVVVVVLVVVPQLLIEPQFSSVNEDTLHKGRLCVVCVYGCGCVC